MSFFDAFGSFTLGPEQQKLLKEREDKRKREALAAKVHRDKVAARRKDWAEFQKNVVDTYMTEALPPKEVPALRRDFLPGGDPTVARAQKQMQQTQQEAPIAQASQPQQTFSRLKRG